MANIAVIVLKTEQIEAQPKLCSTRLQIEDNIGEAIHIHWRNLRLDFSIRDFIKLAEVCSQARSNLNAILLEQNETIQKPQPPQAPNIRAGETDQGKLQVQLDPVFIKTMGQMAQYVKEAKVLEMPLDNLLCISKLSKQPCRWEPKAIIESMPYKCLQGNTESYKCYIEQFGEPNHDIQNLHSLKKSIEQHGYPYNNNMIVVFGDEPYIRDGQHRAAILRYLHGNIRVPVLQLLFKDDYTGWRMNPVCQTGLSKDNSRQIQPKQKILIVRPDAIGDYIIFSSSLKYFKKLYPDARIHILVQKRIAELARPCPYIDEVITFESREKIINDSEYAGQIIRRLQEYKFDIAINPVYSRDKVGEFLTLNSSARELIASIGDDTNISMEQRLKNNSYYTKIIPAENIVMLETKRNEEFMRGLGAVINEPLMPKIWIEKEDEDFIKELISKLGVDIEKAMIICPFAQFRQKEWSISSWTELISCYNNFPIIICGAEKDKESADRLKNAAGHPNIYNLCGKITLRQLAALLQRSRICVTVDSAPAHIAAAVNCPHVVLLGGGHYGRFLPYSPLTTLVSYQMQCYNCNWKCRQNDILCIKNISVGMVHEAIGKSLTENDKVCLTESANLRYQADRRLMADNENGQDKYLVSAIVSTYNSEKYLRGCLDDLEQQTIADKMEIIVVNSGSQENEEVIVNEFQQKYNNIVYIKTEKREGIYSAWNRAVKAAHGTFLTNANTDDRHRDDAFEFMVNALESNPHVGLVYGDQIRTDTPNDTFADNHGTEELRRSEYSRERLLFGCCTGSQPMWRRSLHDELGYFDESLTCAGDWDFWLRISEKHELKRIPEFLGLYYHNEAGIEHGAKIHSLYERYLVGKRYGNPYISIIQQYKSRNNTLISVIMPAYNAAKDIASAIESVLIQNYRNFELIIINDGSTDNTEEIILSYKDEKIRYFKQENRGLAATHNRGIKESFGEYVIKLDTDDMMMPDFISRHLQEFEQYPDTDLVYCDDYLIDENAKPIRVIKRPEYSNRNLLIRDLFKNGFPVVPFRTCIKRSVFDKIGFFDEGLLIGEDYDMMRRFVRQGLIILHLKEPLYLRRMNSQSLSKSYSRKKAENLFEILERYTKTFEYNELFPDTDWNQVMPGKERLYAKCLTAETFIGIGKTYLNSKDSHIYAYMAFEKAKQEYEKCLEMEPENPFIQKIVQQFVLDKVRIDEDKMQTIS
ncbi:MAG: glycosyltransferase [Sedimentisphaerales bacterium]|nr:glycosyltransferase [Sedimentisphaerales bacterium]